MAKRKRRRKADTPRLIEKHAGQGYAWIGGKWHHIGPIDEPTTHEDFELALRLAASQPGGILPPDWRDIIDDCTPETASIETMGADYLDAQKRHFDAVGDPGKQFSDCRRAVANLTAALPGGLPCSRLGKTEFVMVRDYLETKPGKSESRPTAGYVSRQLTAIRRMIEWADGKGIYGIDSAALIQFAQLKRRKEGTYGLRASDPKTEADLSLVNAVLANENVAPILRAMITFHVATGCRPEEVCRITKGELTPFKSFNHGRNEDEFRLMHGLPAKRKNAKSDTDGFYVWEPEMHKNKKRGKHRVIVVAPWAYDQLKPFLKRSADTPLFSPAEHYRQVNKKRRVGGKPTTAEQFTCATYQKAVRRACLLTFPYPEEIARRPAECDADWRIRTGERRIAFDGEFTFSPIQLRKAGLTALLNVSDRKTAAGQGGHSEKVNERYAQIDIKKIAESYRAWGA